MRILGFYEELWPVAAGKPDGSIRDFTSGTAALLENQTAAYLRAGRELFASMGVVEDIFGSGETVLGGDSIYTDGEWVWRGDLAFYLLAYHLRFPEDFVSKVGATGGAPPPVEDARATELTHEIVPILRSPRRRVQRPPRPSQDWRARFPAVRRLLGGQFHAAFADAFSSYGEALDRHLAAMPEEARRQLAEELRTLLRAAESDTGLAEAAADLGLAVDPPRGVSQRQWLRDMADIIANSPG